jgi:sulfur-oxidizing protein SoxX
VRTLRVSIAGCIFTLAMLARAGADTTAVHDAGLVPYQVIDGGIPAPLTSKPGDPVRGEQIVVDRKLGNCLACHAMPIKQPSQGNIGPNLAGVGKMLGVAQLRLRIVNPKLINPQTIMPAYYRVDGLHDVAKAFANKPILTAQQVEDVVAFLATLK